MEIILRDETIDITLGMEPDGEEIEVDMSKMVFLNKYIEERAK